MVFIHAAKALTGPDLSPVEDLFLVVEDGRISRIESKKAEHIATEVKNSPHYYSLHPNLTLMPCLADAHIHLALNRKSLQSAEREHSIPGLFRTRLKPVKDNRISYCAKERTSSASGGCLSRRLLASES